MSRSTSRIPARSSKDSSTSWSTSPSMVSDHESTSMAGTVRRGVDAVEVVVGGAERPRCRGSAPRGRRAGPRPCRRRRAGRCRCRAGGPRRPSGRPRRWRPRPAAAPPVASRTVRRDADVARLGVVAAVGLAALGGRRRRRRRPGARRRCREPVQARQGEGADEGGHGARHEVEHAGAGTQQGEHAGDRGEPDEHGDAEGEPAGGHDPGDRRPGPARRRAPSRPGSACRRCRRCGSPTP